MKNKTKDLEHKPKKYIFFKLSNIQNLILLNNFY